MRVFEDVVGESGVFEVCALSAVLHFFLYFRGGSRWMESVIERCDSQQPSPDAEGGPHASGWVVGVVGVSVQL